MILVWLIFWLVMGTPDLQPWNVWLVTLVMAFVIDINNGSRGGGHAA